MIERKYEDNHKNEDNPIMKMNLIMKTISKKEDSPKNEEICKKRKGWVTGVGGELFCHTIFLHEGLSFFITKLSLSQTQDI